MTAEQAQKVGVSQQPPNKVLSQHMHDFVQESAKQVSKIKAVISSCNIIIVPSLSPSLPPSQESGELSGLVQKARENLSNLSHDVSLQESTKFWLQLLTQPAETEVYAPGSGIKLTNFNRT